MKKFLFFLFFVSSLVRGEQYCSIISSPAQNTSTVAGVDTIAKTYSRVYYDKDSKLQIKSFHDAYIDFFKDATDYVQEQCKKYKVRHIYNFKVGSNVDKDYYYFYATYDFEF